MERRAKLTGGYAPFRSLQDLALVGARNSLGQRLHDDIGRLCHSNSELAYRRVFAVLRRYAIDRSRGSEDVRASTTMSVASARLAVHRMLPPKPAAPPQPTVPQRDRLPYSSRPFSHPFSADWDVMEQTPDRVLYR